jgi:hypothetical protein
LTSITTKRALDLGLGHGLVAVGINRAKALATCAAVRQGQTSRADGNHAEQHQRRAARTEQGSFHAELLGIDRDGLSDSTRAVRAR